MQVGKQNVTHESKTKTGNFTVRTEKTRLERFLFYYINTSEIPSELSRENFISSHVKIYMSFAGREVRVDNYIQRFVGSNSK